MTCPQCGQKMPAAMTPALSRTTTFRCGYCEATGKSRVEFLVTTDIPDDMKRELEVAVAQASRGQIPVVAAYASSIRP